MDILKKGEKENSKVFFYIDIAQVIIEIWGTSRSKFLT